MKIDPLQREQAGTLGELLRVALPLIISYGSTAMMYVVDRIFLSWDSVDSMAAALPAGVLHYNLAILAIGTVAYGNAFIGQYEGAGQHQRVGPVIWQGIYISLAAALAMLIFVPLAPRIFEWFDHDSKVQSLELRFFTILCWGTLPLLLDTALSSFFSGRGQTTVVMVVNTIGMMINIGLDYLLIFGNGGFPRMGIAGAALATVMAFSSISLMYIAAMFWMYRHGPYRLWAGRRFDRDLFSRLFRFGFPSGLQQFLDIACWNMFVQLVGRLGNEQLSATSLVFNLNGGVFIPLLGLGTAVTVLVGHRIGEGRPQLAVRTTWLAYGLASGYTLLFCGVYLLMPDLMLRPYGLADHDSLRELVVGLLRFVAFYSFFDSMFVVFNAAIRGAGDTRFALLFSFSMGLLLLVLPTYIASRFGTEGFSVAWYAVTAFITVLGLGFMARFHQGRWMTMRVIEHTAAELIESPDSDAAPEALTGAVS
ncbi:MAG: MATE family efflux transporter [Planctomycetia bacterium]|nr:MATE family efflux transporter [Planctomycetia bacterium]